MQFSCLNYFSCKLTHMAIFFSTLKCSKYLNDWGPDCKIFWRNYAYTFCNKLWIFPLVPFSFIIALFIFYGSIKQNLRSQRFRTFIFRCVVLNDNKAQICARPNILNIWREIQKILIASWSYIIFQYNTFEISS